MSDGRPGSGATLAAVVAAALFPTLATWLYFVVLPGSRWMLPVYAVCKVVQFGFPLFWLKLRRPASPGPSPPDPLSHTHSLPPGRGGTGKGLLGGLISGLGIAAVLFLIWETLLAGGPLAARAAAAVSTKLAGFGIETLGGYLLLAVFYSVFHSLLEEYYWRWFVFGRVRRTIPVTLAAVLSSLAFMSHHVLVVGELAGTYDARTWLLASTVGAGGLVWAWLYHRSRSLYGPWLSHALADAALLWIGYGLWR
jgi:membrane protease YdiL (CAAX protease family)